MAYEHPELLQYIEGLIQYRLANNDFSYELEEFQDARKYRLLKDFFDNYCNSLYCFLDFIYELKRDEIEDESHREM